MNLKYTVKMIAATMSQMTTSGTGPIAKKTMLPKTVTKGSRTPLTVSSIEWTRP